MRVLSYREARRMALEHLAKLARTLPETERYKPMYVIAGKVLSLADLIREVMLDTDIGRLYVYTWARERGIAIVG